MPTYEYECLKCKKNFEAFQSMTEPALDKCPECGGKAKRLISAGSGLIFKGSGFYVNDYKKNKPAPEIKKPAPCQSCDNTSCGHGKE